MSCVSTSEAVEMLQRGAADLHHLAAVLLPSQRPAIAAAVGAVPIAVSVAIERDKKGRRLRVRGPDGRAVRCCKAWRPTVQGAAAIMARDVGTHWQAAGR